MLSPSEFLIELIARTAPSERGTGEEILFSGSPIMLGAYKELLLVSIANYCRFDSVLAPITSLAARRIVLGRWAADIGATEHRPESVRSGCQMTISSRLAEQVLGAIEKAFGNGVDVLVAEFGEFFELGALDGVEFGGDFHNDAH